MAVSVSGGAYLYSREAYEPHREKVATNLATEAYAAFQHL
ncbi:MAG: hypothetical protein JWP80_1872 [Pseudomonas sp.]|nr:hypothetical protein [Pseudomonas sp.]